MFWSLGTLFLKENGVCDLFLNIFHALSEKRNIFNERIFIAMCQAGIFSMLNTFFFFKENCEKCKSYWIFFLGLISGAKTK